MCIFFLMNVCGFCWWQDWTHCSPDRHLYHVPQVDNCRFSVSGRAPGVGGLPQEEVGLPGQAEGGQKENAPGWWWWLCREPARGGQAEHWWTGWLPATYCKVYAGSALAGHTGMWALLGSVVSPAWENEHPSLGMWMCVCLLQIAETGHPGMFRLWALIGNDLHMVKLTVPRIFYVNQKTSKEGAGSSELDLRSPMFWWDGGMLCVVFFSNGARDMALPIAL